MSTVVDYEANLALLEPTDKKFLDGLEAARSRARYGGRRSALCLATGNTGALVVTEGLVTTIGMTRYPAEMGDFLTYRLSIPMQYRENSYTVPLVKKDKLAALLLRYDPRTQVLDAIPAPIIAHFLKDADTQNYRGFPSVGFGFFPTRDPDLRKYAGQTGKPAGVYVTSVQPEMPAAKAGLKVGDIIAAIGKNELDQNGNYVDPLYGKIEFTNLITAHAFVGDTLQFHIQREGKPLRFEREARTSRRQRLRHPALQSRSTAVVLCSGRPDFSGTVTTVFARMGRQLAEGRAAAFRLPRSLSIGTVSGIQSHFVVLSQVLPANNTIGYDDLAYLVVQKVNGQEIKSLGDLAEAVKHPVDGFIKIETEEDPKQLELDAAQVEAEASALQQNYGLPSLQRLD